MIGDIIIEKYIVFANNTKVATFSSERAAKWFSKTQSAINPDIVYSYRKKIQFV